MEKQAIRDRVWDALEASGEARFPYPPHGRIPNFAGADAAAERLAGIDEWAAADVVKANPDAPQLPVRRAALRQGKTVYMAVPRLREEECFRRLDPAEIADPDRAATIGGSAEAGVQVGPEAMDCVDFVVSGSVAVSEGGARIGKGEGYSDLEFAVLAEYGLVNASTTVATTVHGIQVFDAPLPTTAHDVPMDLVVTPDRTVRPDADLERPTGIRWDEVADEKVEEVPVLQRLRE